MYRLKVHTGSDDAVTGGSGWRMKASSLDFTLLRETESVKESESPSWAL